MSKDRETLNKLRDELNALEKQLTKGDDLPTLDLPYVIVRTVGAGVHAGFLEGRKGQEVTLRMARRLNYWEGAFTLSALAAVGTKKPDKCMFSVEVDQIELLTAIEIIPLTPQLAYKLRSIPAHDPA